MTTGADLVRGKRVHRERLAQPWGIACLVSGEVAATGEEWADLAYAGKPRQPTVMSRTPPHRRKNGDALRGLSLTSPLAGG